MRRSRALSAAAALTGAALAIKGAALARPEPVEDVAGYLATMGKGLRAAGFAVVTDRRGFVTAQRGACRLKARDLHPLGNAQAAFERVGAAFGPTRYAWRGRWRDAPPKYGPLLHYYAQRELARIGIALDRRGIAAVAAGPACAGLSADTFDATMRMR